jgi:hypothetical protein
MLSLLESFMCMIATSATLALCIPASSSRIHNEEAAPGSKGQRDTCRRVCKSEPRPAQKLPLVVLTDSAFAFQRAWNFYTLSHHWLKKEETRCLRIRLASHPTLHVAEDPTPATVLTPGCGPCMLLTVHLLLLQPPSWAELTAYHFHLSLSSQPHEPFEAAGFADTRSMLSLAQHADHHRVWDPWGRSLVCFVAQLSLGRSHMHCLKT